MQWRQVRSALVVAAALMMEGVFACEAPDCDREDCGTCGNACCEVELSFPGLTEPQQLVLALNSSLAGGGPDGRFSLRPTAESAYGFGDLRPYKSEVSFIGQAFHLTAKRQYTDTVNMLIFSGLPVRMRAFSISQIGGAYCDAGQNFKNIAVLVKSLNISSEIRELSNRGCATKKPNSQLDGEESQLKDQSSRASIPL